MKSGHNPRYDAGVKALMALREKGQLRHTLSPWVAEGRVIRADARVVAAAGNMACDSAYPASETRSHIAQAEVDARLIAAAPDLLEALKDVLRATNFDDSEPWIVQAHAAIAKATGGSGSTSAPQGNSGLNTTPSSPPQREERG